MRRAATSHQLGDLIRVDRPLPRWQGWSFIVSVTMVCFGWTLALPDTRWQMGLPVTLVGLLCCTYIFGERFLIEQRIYERGLVSRSLVPFVGVYVLPFVAVDTRSIRITERFRWTDDGERHLPAAASLRCLPWGPVLRVRAPKLFSLKALARADELFVDEGRQISNYHAYAGEWIFSFTDPQAIAALLTDLIAAENARVGPDRRDIRRMFDEIYASTT